MLLDQQTPCIQLVAVNLIKIEYTSSSVYDIVA